MYGIMEEKHIVSNFISHLSHALVVSSLPTSPIPDVKSRLRSDPWTTPQGLSQKDSKGTPAGSWNAVFSQASMHVFKGKELVHTWQRDLWISPHEMIFFEHIGVLILQRLLLLCERGGKYEDAFERPPLPPWFSEHCDSLNVISPLSLLAFFMGPSISFPGYLYYMAHSSWHILFLLSDRFEGVKSLWVLFLILSGQLVHR